ncbi:MAG: hypothetical protein ACM3IJ_05675 [Candidatus Levyibacteriota bacterium]
MLNTLVIVSDYGVGDPAFAEVSVRLRSLVPDLFILPISTPAFSTINTGFWISQIALAPGVSDTYIFSNTAPRKDDKKAQKNNNGEKLMYAKLQNGSEIIAVNSGYCFSFVKPHIKDFHFVEVSNEGSQFRSRDNYPQKVAEMIAGRKDFIGEKGSIDSIPEVPENRIASIDGYGNIKTTARLSSAHFQPGQKLLIQLNSFRHQVTFSDGVFNIHEGEVAFAPGSSGYDDKFMELFERGGSASKLFGNPLVEQEFKIIGTENR